MPRLSDQLQLKTVTLPISGGVVKIGLSYGDKLYLQGMLMSAQKMVTTEKVNDGKKEKESKTEVDTSVLGEEAKHILERGIKEWDFTEDDGRISPITFDNISKLPPADGTLLKDELGKLIYTEKEDETKKKEDKKK